MRRTYAVALALLTLACAATASHLETVFSVSMPYAEAFFPGYASVHGDILYVVCGPIGSVVEAVNLTTRTNMWVSPNYTTTYGAIDNAAGTDQVLLLSFGNILVALSAQTGQQLWVQSGGYQLLYPGGAYVYGNTIYAQVLLPSYPSQLALQAFDLATGAPGYFQYGNNLHIDGNTAFIGGYGVNDVNPYLRALDIPTNTTLWTLSAPVSCVGQLVQAVNSEYVVISNFSDGVSGLDQIALVLHRKNGSVAQAFQAFNGFEQHGVAALHGHMFFTLIGGAYPRYVLADVTTGEIVWTRSATEIGGVFSGDALVSISYGLVLTITPIGGSGSSIIIPQVPSLPSPTIVDFGFGVVQVGNLQGYTMWDTVTGNFLGSNDQMPIAAVTAPLQWNGLSIMVSGNVVTALKVAR